MINVTPAAIARIKEAIKAEDKPNLNLRIYVEGGGCSGMQYGLSFEEKTKEDDEVIAQDGVNILIDPVSLTFLKGIEIDFHSSLKGSGFTFSNPNATGSCGCGTSFKV